MNEKRNTPITNGDYESEYMRVPIYETRWNRIKQAFYNPNDGTILTRTKKQWGITAVFYSVFFSGLALMFALCMTCMLATLNDERPRFILDDSLIGTNPGLAFRPIHADETTLISYKVSNETDVKYWIDRADTFLAGYQNSSKLSNGGRNQEKCNYTQYSRSEKVCDFDLSDDWGPCTSANGYGYSKAKPCIFIKLNRVIGWMPQVYNDTNQLPKEMPESLVKKINSLKDTPQMNTVWLSCKGRNAEHDESMGKIEYYPSYQGFPAYYYPYENKPDYLSPLVAIHFENPKHNKLISMECRAWAKNLKQELFNQIGVVLFQLSIND